GPDVGPPGGGHRLHGEARPGVHRALIATDTRLPLARHRPTCGRRGYPLPSGPCCWHAAARTRGGHVADRAVDSGPAAVRPVTARRTNSAATPAVPIGRVA